MLRTKDWAGLLGIAIMIITFVILIIKRKKLGKGSGIFITAMGTFAFVEAYSTIRRLLDINYDSTAFYSLGISLLLFLLFLLYFHSLLQNKNRKSISFWIIVIFLLQYILSAYFIERFFTNPPFASYLAGVVLLAASASLVISQIFNSDKVLTLQHYFPFWACISVMIIFVGALPLLLTNYSEEQLHPNIFFAIVALVNILGYCVLLLGIFKAENDH